MNNDELKKKIENIVAMAMLEADEFPFVETAEYVADALIAAGIGDVKEAETERKAYEVVSNQYRIFFEEQKYWRWVAERALKDACTNIIKDEEDDLAVEPRARVLYNAYFKQAEKELAEEK